MSFRAFLIGPVAADRSMSESLSWRRRFRDKDGGDVGAEVRVGLVGSEEGPGIVRD